MRKLTVFLFSLLFLFTGCSNGDWEVTVKTTPFYKEGVAAPFAVQIKENGKLAKQLKVHATFEMSNMDHGKIEVDLHEKGNGIYEENVQLPMEGDWEALLVIKKGSDKVEKLLKMHVKKEEAVAKVGKEKITMDDVRFYQALSKIEIAIQKERAQTTYKGAALNEQLAYWDRREQYANRLNQAVSHLVELQAMALLAEEKGHGVTKQEIAKTISALRSQYARYETAQQIIHVYGEKKFWEDYSRYSKLRLLANDVYNDLAGAVKKANPTVSDSEIRYLAQKQYEELLLSQIDSLHVELYLPNRLS
ncbi:FixH family protein [Anoxybacillus sp. J5B_2022]|uniref:FixH family protein n=1 Tax=Anoxybacillus sp. J5B_2022 TaxID=3003246 RepID=UPI0022857EEC|nr:FixH family protein [Anoxybacillus sp. J5B_2022]MCZ0756191.1 FixH family protein [Anoxybacillus sp. J5B_2022]